MRDFLRNCVIGQRGLIGVPLLLELHGSEQENRRHYSEDGIEVFHVHAHNVHRLDRRLELDGIINSWNW